MGASRTVSAVVDIDAVNTNRAGAQGAAKGSFLALAAGPSGAAGDYSATSLSGGELIYNASKGYRHLRRDDGTRAERIVGGSSYGNGDNDGEYWKVTTTDGTQYWFGRNKLAGWTSGKALTDSTWTAPVFGNDPGEPCRASTFAASDCNQAWRWNLDYVVDPHGKTMSFWYTRETNGYARNNTAPDVATYTRGGYLNRIEYGTDNRTSVGGTPTDSLYRRAPAVVSPSSTRA